MDVETLNGFLWKDVPHRASGCRGHMKTLCNKSKILIEFQFFAGQKRLAGNGVANGVISARAWILWVIGKNPRAFHKNIDEKS